MTCGAMGGGLRLLKLLFLSASLSFWGYFLPSFDVDREAGKRE